MSSLKRQKILPPTALNGEDEEEKKFSSSYPKVEEEEEEDEVAASQAILQFVDPGGSNIGDLLNVPLGITRSQLQKLLNSILDNEEELPYTFHLEDQLIELSSTLSEALKSLKGVTSEKTLRLTFYPLSTFKVRPVTRCTASLEGHTAALLCVAFSPDGRQLASGSGDTTVRFWDLNTQCPLFSCRGHTHWVLCVSWSPDAKILASAGMDTAIRLWNPVDGKGFAEPLLGHTKAITCLAWQPLHLVGSNAAEDVTKPLPKLISGSKDLTLRIWDCTRAITVAVLTSHINMITQVRWSGQGGPDGSIYSASRDTLIKVWDPSDGRLLRNLKGHGHWVNTLALNTDMLLRAGPFDHKSSGKLAKPSNEGLISSAKLIYEEGIKLCGGERLLSGSDDHTMYLWDPQRSQNPLCRMTGHQKLINQAVFSADGRFIASASFDKTIRLWDGRTGKFLATLRGHVGPVYQLSWAPDSKLLASASADSTAKIWDPFKAKLKGSLPGHADQVFAIDWSLDGGSVATGSKDKLVKLWKN